MPKRILIFSLAYYPSHISGAEVAIKELTDRIDPHKIDFSMITHRFDRSVPKVERLGNVTVYRVGFGPSYMSKILFVPLAAYTARLLHTKQPFDAMWAMMTYMLFPVVLCKLLGLRLPYVLTLQDGDPYEKVFERWFIRPVAPILDWGIRHATIIQAISTYLSTWPRRRGYTRTVITVPNGASVQSSQDYTEEELAPIRAKLDKKEGEILLLSIGRLVHQKAIDDCLRALALLPTHVRLVVVGEGSDRQMLEQLTRELKVESRVLFVGHVDRSETAKYRKLCDIFVSPSRSEGQGISFLSTMVSGLPLVATQEGGLADFVFDTKRNPDKQATAWAVDRDSPQQIAEAVQEILANPTRAQEVAHNAREMVLRDYNWGTIAKTMEQKVFLKALQQSLA